MILFLGLINLLEWLTEFRETFYLLDYMFVIKGCNSGTASWKKFIGQGMGKGRGACMVSKCTTVSSLCVLQPRSSPDFRSLDFYEDFIT